jgi:hypothetical protein
MTLSALGCVHRARMQVLKVDKLLHICRQRAFDGYQISLHSASIRSILLGEMSCAWDEDVMDFQQW